MPDPQDLPGSIDAVRTALLQSDERFRNLVTEHHALDERIRHLSQIIRLNYDQQVEQVALKKQKLALKDRIEAMVRQRPSPAVGA